MSILEFESDASKENQNPMLRKAHKDLIFRDEAIIDMEIEQIEMEMRFLFTKLETLKLEKQRINIRRKQSMNPKLGFLQKIQDSKQRRGVSLCPSEIYSATKSGQVATKGDLTNTNSTVNVKQSSNRRQSCFWKLGEIDELKITKERGSGNGTSISPKPPRKAAAAAQIINNATKKTKAVTTSSSVQPKRLFRDTERSLASKKPPIQPSRAVASRYNHNIQSLSVDGVGKVRALSMSGAESGGRVKKRWEIPAKGEVVVYKSCDDRESTLVIDEIGNDVLPKIRRSLRDAAVNQSL